jgi:hypothetical protein
MENRVCITAAQLKAALEFVAPDGTPEQLEDEVTIGYLEAEGGRVAGHYAWLTDYPDEGGMLLETSDAPSLKTSDGPGESSGSTS